ncbi:MAG: 30S ribosomal protein S27e [Candidatus Aenigmatarchaeota archaeon]
MDFVSAPKSKFINVMCKKCKNKQVIFSKASTVVRCLKCGEVLAEPKGGDSLIKGKVLEVFG